MDMAAIGDNPVMRLFPRSLIHYAPLAALFSGGLGLLGGCGSIEWPPPEYAPADINTSPGGAASSAAFLGASAVVAGRGDTVYAISRRHRVPVRAIIEANGLKPPYHLRAGQRVTLPRGRQHVVTRGDTLYGIARRYRADPYALARANGLRPPYAIQAGQQLVLPGPPVRNKPPTAKPAFKRGQRTRPLPAAVPRPPPVSGKGFVWPVRGRVVSGFGAKAKGLRNDGINIAAKRGTPVKASENGVVVYVGNELRGFGNLLLIKHAGGWVTAYAHNDKILVKRGDRVGKGQKVATVGSTGSVRNPQLHFELRRGRRPTDPRKHLRGV
jgi:murein DD-endopeptidase MepM/ murein hydrolase activator NlpD